MGKVATGILKRIIDRVMRHYGKDLPPPQFSAGGVSEYDVPMRDGIKLKTYVYFPACGLEKPSGADKPVDGKTDSCNQTAQGGDNRFPVLFVRTPYCYEFDVYRYIFQNFVKHGFILCYQECRGRGGSEGGFEPFEYERNDGIDTVAWMKSREWYSGSIVPMGVSYLAMNQLLYCDTWDADFKTAVLSMYGGNLYGLAYENGMFRDEFFTVWTFNNNGVRTVEGDEAMELYDRHASVFPRSSLMRETLGGEVDFYSRLIGNPSRSDGVWDGQYFMPDASVIKTPLCLITGWYDFTVKGVIEIFNSLSKEVRKKSTMLIGPWTHVMQNSGDLKTPGHYIGGFMGFKYALKWLIQFFYGAENEVKNGVRYYVVNKGCYQSSKVMPQHSEHSYFLTAGRSLTQDKPAENNPPERGNSAGGVIKYVYDPEDPVFTHGGGSAFPTLTPFIRRRVQCVARLPDEVRDDVILFESPPLSSARTVLGGRVELCVASSAADTCFSVKLCTRERNRLYAFSYGITNIVNNLGQNMPYRKGEKRKLIIDLSPIAFRLKKGASLVLCVASSDYPSFHLHLNNGSTWSAADKPVKAVQSIYTDESELKIYYKRPETVSKARGKK